MISKKHIEIVAKAIGRRLDAIADGLPNPVSDARIITESSLITLARDLATTFEAEDPSFDRERFLRDAGVKKLNGGAQ